MLPGDGVMNGTEFGVSDKAPKLKTRKRKQTRVLHMVANANVKMQVVTYLTSLHYSIRTALSNEN